MCRAFGAFLDSERPDVVHIEHLQDLGLGVLDAVRERSLASLYQAHDFFLVADCPTLCGPDLSDLVAGDVDGLARARLGRAFLSRFSQLGNHHGWVLEGDLEREPAEQLRAILDGPADSVDGLQAARETIIEVQATGRAIAAGVDRCYVSSPQLLRVLQAELGRALEVQPAGIDVQHLSAGKLHTDCATLRLGFLGGISKHKGLHLLLDAFEQLAPGKASLTIHGGGTDRVYLEHMRQRASAVGAEWCGDYRTEELGRILANVDVLVVPSLWVENAPFVIMEAHAAGCPVVVSRSAFTVERVREGFDGLLFERGDVHSLVTSLTRLIVEPSLLAFLRGGITVPFELSLEAQQWTEVYGDLKAQKLAVSPQRVLPAHLEEFVSRYRDLARLPTRELFTQVSRGLESLADRMGLDESPMEFTARAIGRGSRLRDEAHEGRRVQQWFENETRSHSEALVESQDRASWREEQLSALEQQLDWYAKRIEQGEADIEGLQGEYARLAQAKEHADGALGELRQENQWLTGQVAGRDASQVELQARLSDAQAALENYSEEREWLQGALTAREGQQRELQAQKSDLRNARDECERAGSHARGLEQELVALRTHEQWLRGEVQSLLSGVLPDGSGAQAARPEPDEVARHLTAGTRELTRILAELDWRRAEMLAAGGSAQTLRSRLMGGDLGHRARQWHAPGAPRESEVPR